MDDDATLEEQYERRFRTALGSSLATNNWRGTLSWLLNELSAIPPVDDGTVATLADCARAELALIASGTDTNPGLRTGLNLEEFCATGIPLDKVTTIFGETGNFKTTLASNLAWNIAASGTPVLFISFEDSTQLLAQRLLARINHVAYGDIAARKITALSSDTGGEIADRIFTPDGVEPNIDAIISKARYCNKRFGVRAVFVDYLQIMHSSQFESQKDVIDDAFRKAQEAARLDKMAYVFVSQVNSTVRFRDAKFGGPRPLIDDCLGSSGIRIGTKLGIGVFHPFKHWPSPSKDNPQHEGLFKLANKFLGRSTDFFELVYPNLLELVISKNVMGESPATTYAIVNPATGTIAPYHPEGVADEP